MARELDVVVTKLSWNGREVDLCGDAGGGG